MNRYILQIYDPELKVYHNFHGIPSYKTIKGAKIGRGRYLRYKSFRYRQIRIYDTVSKKAVG